MEKLMQYVWNHRLWPRERMTTVDGRKVTIIDGGRLNTGPGPDFFNAKVKIGDRVWAGDIEIHVRASDWRRHGHHTDPAYDSVILHVVDRDDTPVHRRNGELIPQMRMPCSTGFHQSYNNLVARADIDLPCAASIASMERIYLADWLTTLAMERLYEKSDRVTQTVTRFAGDWQQACFVTVARALGFGVNAEPMQRLASSLPLRVLYKHADSLLTIEAIIFGQAGLLDSAPSSDPYVQRLRSEHAFMSRKFGLQPSPGLGWKMGGMRPGSFPHRRLALLAALVAGGFRLLDSILEARTEEAARAIFDRELSGYWADRYTFASPPSNRTPKVLSSQMLSLMLINVVAPVQMAHALATGDPDATDKAIELLESLPPESNSVVTLFARVGIKARDALTTQALIRLRRSYCETRKCLYCRIGHRMLSRCVANPES